MGLYRRDEIVPVQDVRNWEAPGDTHPEPKLRELWEQELGEMRDRIKEMRRGLAELDGQG